MSGEEPAAENPVEGAINESGQKKKGKVSEGVYEHYGIA